MSMVSLRSILSDRPFSIQASEPIAKALEIINEQLISSIVIVDNAKRPIGIFTEYDAVRIVSESIALETPVSEVMTAEPFCVEDALYLHDAYVMMEEKRIRHLIVVDEHGTFSGVVSEGDFLRHMGLEHLSRLKSVSEAMNDTLLVIQPDTLLVEAASLMNHRKCDYAVVMDGLTPCGIITERDIAKWCLRTGVAKDTDVSGLVRNDFRLVNKDLPLQDAASMMQQHNVHQLMVIDSEGALAGLLTRHDVLHAVHGAYFDFLIRVIDQKSATIEHMSELEKQLLTEKEHFEKSELKLRNLFSALPEGVLLINSQTMKAVEFNRTAHEQLGYSAEEFAQLKVNDYEAIEQPDETRRRAEAIIREGRDTFETVHRTKTGELIDVWVNIIMINLDEVPHFMTVYRDISELKQAQRDLMARNEEVVQKGSFLHTLINTIPDLIWLKDIEGKYLACNRMFERLYNNPESAIVGKNDFDFVPAELAQFFRNHDMAAIAAGGSRTNEEFLKFGDGSYEGYFETVKTPMRDADGNVLGVLGVARDISERKKNDDEIRRVQELAHVGTWEWDLLADEFVGSDETNHIFGFPKGKILSITEVVGCVHEADRERVEQEVTKAFWDGVFDTLYRVQREDGQIRWVKVSAEFQPDATGRQVKGIGLIQDLTERMRHEEQMRHKDIDLNAAQALAHIGSWRLDIQNDSLEWSDETYRIFGIEIGTPLTYESFVSVIHPDDKAMVDNAWKLALQGEPYEIEHRIIVNGEEKWVREKAQLDLDSDGKLLAGVGTVQVITERKLYEKRLETMANYDALTGLANRSLLLASLKNSIDKAARSQSNLALLMFDLDRFKDINDSFGHSAGDELLQLVAGRFTERLRDGDQIARLGGDEFAIVLDQLSRVEDAGRIAEEIIEALAAPYRLKSGAEIHIGASAGIVIYPDHGKEAEKLLQYADAALYKAKSEGRGNYAYYTDDLTVAARKRLLCENQLRRAVENQEFEVYYQPQVHLETGRIVGAEALVRWNDPERGRISPAEFIPIAEETGLIRDIGEWVLNETCRQGKTWLEKGHRLTLAVNLSANQIRHQNVLKMVEDALKKSGLPASRLELEITESALMQREEEAVAMMHSLRAHGIRLAIDDFGTGYSSLSYLKRFPIDVLKIDKTFIDDVPYDQDDMAIVNAIIAMGHALGYQVLAEGAEREEQVAFLKQQGCTMYQGYFKSPPVPAAEFEKLLE